MRGDVLFTCSESPDVHRFIKWKKPWKVMAFGVGLSIFFWGSIIFVLLKDSNFSWGDAKHGLEQIPGMWFILAWTFLIVLVNVLFRPSPYIHRFYENVARVHRGHGKNPYVWIRPQDIEYMEMEKVNFRSQEFYMITIRFKSLEPKFLGRPSNLRFGIETQDDVKNLLNWTRNREIPLRKNLSAQFA